MIFYLIGHRGSGKSSCLDSLRKIFGEADLKADFYDLDKEVEKAHGPIEKIFSRHGEDEFRKLEEQTLKALVFGRTDSFVSVGAGYPGDFPAASEVVWIRRESDKSGRIFLDRPSLEPKVPPLEEWALRFSQREESYFRRHSQILTLPEGERLNEKVLKDFFSFWFPSLKAEGVVIPYDATLIPEDRERVSTKRFYTEARKIEWREDFFDHLAEEPLLEGKKTYVAHRKGELPSLGVTYQDWDLSLGKPQGSFWSVSSHGKEMDFSATQACPVLKWAPLMKDFKELLRGHQWFKENPKGRAFLPRSQDGRWRWYRRLFGSQMPLHFLRDYKGSSPDQPFWYEAHLPSLGNDGFAAVLGGRVSCSWTPSFHGLFFAKFQMPVVSIDVSSEEFTDAFEVLKALGLRAAAVTSPLKTAAFEKVTHFERPNDSLLGSINTLYIDGDEVRGVNTDLSALTELAKNEWISPMVVWGGGGLKPVLQRVFPQASFVKAREGAEIPENSTVIWASTRSQDVCWPSPLKNIHQVVDMNYSEDSMGRELAKISGAGYVSGEDFFIKQASHQQDFWSQFL